MLCVISYIVRFQPCDGGDPEEYYYNTLDEASAHFDEFRYDDSGLYEYIELTKLDWYMHYEAEIDTVYFGEE